LAGEQNSSLQVENVDTLLPCVAAVSSVMMNYIHACVPKEEVFPSAGLCKNHKNFVYLVVMGFSTLLQTVDIDSDMIQGINRI
jgi:hypothetical protein